MTRVQFGGHNLVYEPGSLTVELYSKFCVDLYLKRGFHKKSRVVDLLIAGHILLLSQKKACYDLSLRLSPQLCLNFLLVELTHSPFEPYARCTAHGPSFVRLLKYSKASMSDPKWKLPLIFDNKAFSTRSGRAERFHYSMRTVYFNSPQLIYGDFDTRACSGYQALFPLPRDPGDEANATPPPKT